MAESARNGKRAVSIPHPLTTLHPKLLERIAGDRIGNECKKLVCLSNILRYIEERPADWYVLEDDDEKLKDLSSFCFNRQTDTVIGYLNTLVEYELLEITRTQQWD